MAKQYLTHSVDSRATKPLGDPVEPDTLEAAGYVDAHNENGKPFRWTKTADEILDKMRRFGLRTQQVHAP